MTDLSTGTASSAAGSKGEAKFYLPLLAAPPCRVDFAERNHGGGGVVAGGHFQRTSCLVAPGSPDALNHFYLVKHKP